MCEYPHLLQRLPAGCGVVSSEIDRLEQAVPELHSSGFRVSTESLYPSAALLGLRGDAVIKNGSKGEPFEPLYMHPAV
jgi:hypothetical protein